MHVLDEAPVPSAKLRGKATVLVEGKSRQAAAVQALGVTGTPTQARPTVQQ